MLFVIQSLFKVTLMHTYHMQVHIINYVCVDREVIAHGLCKTIYELRTSLILRQPAAADKTKAYVSWETEVLLKWQS